MVLLFIASRNKNAASVDMALLAVDTHIDTQTSPLPEDLPTTFDGVGYNS